MKYSNAFRFKGLLLKFEEIMWSIPMFSLFKSELEELCDDDKVGDDVEYSDAFRSEFKELCDDDKVGDVVEYSSASNQSLRSCVMMAK